jgi:hypothetical protein
MIKVYNSSQTPVFQRLLSNKNGIQKFLQGEIITFFISLSGKSSTVETFHLVRIDDCGNESYSVKLENSLINYNINSNLLQFANSFSELGLFQLKIVTNDDNYKTEPFYIC